MREIVSTITSKGQVTIPLAVRRRLGVATNDKIVFVIDEDQVTVIPLRYTLESVAGSIEPPTRTEDLEDYIEEAKEEHADRVQSKPPRL